MSIEESKPKVSTFGAGLALFSMFFGAGNLIFPLIVGKGAGTETGAALTGLGLSAVAFPFLGLIAMMLYEGNLKLFLAPLGKVPAVLLLFLLYMSQGPVGSMPRLFTLMYASVEPYFSLPLSLFTVVTAAVVFLLTIRRNKLIQLLGIFLTPILIATMGVLIVVGMIHAPSIPQAEMSSLHHFSEGLKGGYQTLDLTAALLFATVMIPYLSQGLNPKTEGVQIRKRMTNASLIAAIALMVSYMGLCWLSAHHSWTLEANLPPVDLFHAIAVKVLGPIGGCISAVTIFLACLTTAISLTAVFADYCQKDLFQNKISSTKALFITLGTTAVMANLGFNGIMKILSPLVEVLYPVLIALCIFNIVRVFYKKKAIS